MFQSGQVYGCSRLRHRDSFWAVKYDEKLFEGYGPHAIIFPTYHLLDSRCAGQSPPCEVAEGSRKYTIRCAIPFNMFGMSLLSSISSFLVILCWKFGPTFAMRPTFPCDYSSLLNAVVSLQVKTVDDAVLKYIDKGKMAMGVQNFAAS